MSTEKKYKTQKKYWPQLRNVKLGAVRLLTLQAWEWKRRICFENAQGGVGTYSELHTPTVIKDIFEDMTPEEFNGWLQRLYPETPQP